MTRLQRFHKLRDHPMIGKDFKKLNKEELVATELFIEMRASLSDDEFCHQANRWFMDMPDRPRSHTVMWGLVMQSVDTVGNLRRMQGRKK